MINIAVVDDDPYILSQLSNIFQRYFQDVNYKQDDYYDGIEFVNSLSEESYDIVFMDIEMQHMSGKTAIETLRAVDEHEKVYVIYISAHTDRVVDLFKLHPFDFLEKPLVPEQIINVLDKILAKRNTDNQYISLIINRKEVCLPVSDIMWIQSYGHKLLIKINGQNEECCCYMKLDVLFTRLKEISSSFMRIHASYVVNRQFVKKYMKHTVLIDEVELPISQKYSSAITYLISEEYSKGNVNC